MKTLILCVDRDDDLGRKANVETPLVGRRRVVEAAMALGLSDPEDSDTNALLATVHLYDKETQAGSDSETRQFEVAAIAGHRLVGLRSDRILAKQLDEVLQLTGADDVVLISDGAEDEQILPILSSRVRVAHIHRSIVKQAPRLEGFLYVLTRMLDDEKLAKRYMLPLSLVFLVWALAFFFDLSRMATALTLGIVGFWLLMHAMRWEERVTRFFQDFGEGMRRGRVSLVANTIMLAILVLGIVQAIEAVDATRSLSYQIFQFMDGFLFFLVTALLVRTAGKLFDEIIREGKASLAHWTFVFTLIAFGFIGGAIVDMSLAMMDGQRLTQVLSFDLVVRLLVGLAVMTSGIVLGRYIKSFFREDALES